MFTKEAAQEALDTLMDMGKRLPKSKLKEFFGHLNEIACFIEDAKRAAPTEADAKQAKELTASNAELAS